MQIVIKKKCKGSPNGIAVKTFVPGDRPVEVPDDLARGLIAGGFAKMPVEKKPAVKKQGVKDTKKTDPNTGAQKVSYSNKAVLPGDNK